MARSHSPGAPHAGHPWRSHPDHAQNTQGQSAYPNLPQFVQNAAAGHAAQQGAQPQAQPGYGPNPYASPYNQFGYGAPPQAQPDLRGGTYDWQQHQAAPLNYDLGNYAPNQNQPYNPSRPGDGGGQWGQGPGPEPYAFAHQANVPAESHYGQEDDYEAEEPRRGGRRWIILSVLIGAVGVGGGMAYYYKTYLAPKSDRTPVIRASKEPLKSLPETSKRTATADGRLGNRLDGASETQDQGELDANGVRRVTTVPVGRDGSMGSTGSVQAPTQQSVSRQPVAIPGMVVDGLLPRVASPQTPAAPQAPAVQTPAAPVAPVTRNPVQIAPQQPAAPVQRQLIARAPQQSEPAAPVQPKSATKVAVPKQQAAKVESTGSTGANGYVAVLSTQKSRMDALKNFADMQQKYAGVLQSKIPDVLEADLSARGLGTMYRVVVGPPGSRDAASTVCGQLKSAGYQHCWVTAY